MDRKAGYKECPRCGLRNKPSALQCDFCGLRFIAGEDWDDNIQALEKMGDSDERVLVDEDVSKRIESTIVKRDKINTPAKAREQERNDNDYYVRMTEPVKSVPAPVVAPPESPEEVSEPVVKETPLEIRQPEPVPEPVIAAPAPEKIIIPEPLPITVTPASEPMPETKTEPVPEPKPVKERKVVRRVVRPVPKVFTPANKPMRRVALAAVLALGAISYLVAIMFGDSTMGRGGGWAMVTLSSMMVVIGAVGLLVPKSPAKMAFAETPAPEVKPSREVLICPKCHEMVKVTDKTCPDCGAEFRSE
ncbi:MAG TPA: hypothetical protein VGK23_03785 [Methanomassiliicoccales archaeon]|jgi:hypothetical protein